MFNLCPPCYHTQFRLIFLPASSFQGLNLYVLTGIATLLVQTVVFRGGAVRRLFGIPALPANTNVQPVTFKESLDHLKKWFREQKQTAQERALAQKDRKW